MPSVQLRYTTDNPQPWTNTFESGRYRHPRRDLASWIGPRAWGLYCCLLLTRDRNGLVRYKSETLADKLSVEWGKPKSVSTRTVKRYLQRLAEVGLVVPTHRKTSGGCRIRRVYGRVVRDLDMLQVPPKTHALFGKDEELRPLRTPKTSAKDVPSVASIASTKNESYPRVPCVSLSVSLRRKMRKPEIEVGGMTSKPTKGVRESRVGVVGDAGDSLLQEEEAAGTRPASLSLLGGAARRRVSRDLRKPEHFPRHPMESMDAYLPPAHPKVRPHDSPGERARILVNAYRAALHFHTRKTSGVYARGIPPKTMKLLAIASAKFVKHNLSPHLWCAAMMAWMRDDAKDKGSTWKPPTLPQIFAPQLIDRFRGMVRARRSEWTGRATITPTAQSLVDRWEECRLQIRLAECKPDATQEDLDAVVDRFFPRGLYAAEIEKVRREHRAMFSRDNVGIQQGRWVW